MWSCAMQKQKPCIALDPHGRSPTYAHSGGTIVCIPFPCYYDLRHRTIGNPFSRPMSPLFSPNSREENPLPSCAHSPHRITTHDGIYELSIRNNTTPRTQYTAPMTLSPFHPGRPTRSSLYIAYFRPLSQWTYLRVQLPAKQSIIVLPQKMALATQVALSANRFTKKTPINATRNKTITVLVLPSRVDFEFRDSRQAR